MAKQVVEACVNAGTCAAGASHYAALISALASIWSQVRHQLVATMNNAVSYTHLTLPTICSV